MANNRWRPIPHRLVLVEADEAETSPAGTWQILARGPLSPTAWWLMPIDGDARRWAVNHPAEVINQCVQVEGRRLRSAYDAALAGNRGV